MIGEWETAVSRGNGWKATKFQFLCSIHFEERWFDRTGETVRLRKNAIPTLFPAFPKYLQKVSKIRKPPKKRTLSDVKTEIYSLTTCNSDMIQITNIDDKLTCDEDLISNNDADTQQQFDSPNKKVLKHKLEKTEELLLYAKKNIKVLQQGKRRLEKKVSSLHEIIDDLSNKKMVSEEGISMLKTSLPIETQHLLSRIIKKEKSYFAELRKFAIILHFCSPAAHEYVRSQFNLCLPSVRIIRQWYSSVNGEPGFNEDACNMLLLLSSKYREKEKMLTAALIIDDMAIRELIEYDGKKLLDMQIQG